MENSYDEECFKKWEIDECEAEMEKVVQWIGKRKLHGRVRVAFIEESYERQGYIYFTSLLYWELPEGAQRKILNLCLDTAWGYPSRRMCPGCWQTSGKKSGEKEITNPKVGVLGKEVVQTNRIFDRRINSGYGKG